MFAGTRPNHDGPADYGESHFAYLSRSTRPAFAAIRDLIERWLSRYPRFHRQALATRLRNRDDEHFEATFFELYLHEMLTQLGCTVQPHPRVGHQRNGRRPDFRVTQPPKQRWLLEAVTASELSAPNRAVEARLNAAYNALNRLDTTDYFLNVEVHGKPETPIPGKALRRHTAAFLGRLDYEAVRAAAATTDLGNLPTTTFAHDGCTLRISVIPKSPTSRGVRRTRAIGMLGPGEARLVDNRGPLRDAIRRKASRYGRIRQPYIVAVNARGQHLDRTDVMEALFGTEEYLLTGRLSSDHEPIMQRRPDGVWSGPRGPRHTRVSAVVVVSSLLPWSVAAQQPVLYINPWARYPCPTILHQLTTNRPIDGRMVETPGRAAAEVFGLPDGWPGD